jgi:tetratricopeptide (TPR) repeat protein
VDQSKAEQALPIIKLFGGDAHLTVREQAEVAMLRATVEFSLNREVDTKYYEVAKIALDAANRTGDVKLISRALFEFARAGTEEGLTELVQTAETGIDKLAEQMRDKPLPMIALTKAFCRFFFWDHQAAVSELQRVLQSEPCNINAAELAFLYSGMGIAKHFLGQFQDARDAFTTALGFANKVGDDHRIAQIASNLCAVQMVRGLYDDAIKYGEMSIRFGEACGSGGLLPCYTNLMDSYLLVGRVNDAVQCLENARKWLTPERRWRLRCAFFIEAAAFALSQHNHGLALDIIEQLEVLSRGQEQAVPMPGPYWKLMIFREAHISGSRQAHDLAKTMIDRLYMSCPFHCLDIAASMAWLDQRMYGRVTEETENWLLLFDSLKAEGKRALLTIQGFLTPRQRNDLGSEMSTVSQAIYPH